MIIVLLFAVFCHQAHGLQITDLDNGDLLEMRSSTSPLSKGFNITAAILTLPAGNWASCMMDESNRFKAVLVTMVKSPCTIQDWLTTCENYQCTGLVLHTLYSVPGLVLSHRVDQIAIVEVSNTNGLHINDLLRSGRRLSVSMTSLDVNEWVTYFESHEFIWAMTMPSSAAACIGVLNFFKMKEKMGGLVNWRSIPLMHAALVVAETFGLGFRSALGFGLGTTQGTGFSFEHFIWMINLVIVIYAMSNLTLGLAFRDMYCTLMKKKPPMNNYIKVLTFVLCVIIFVLHYLYNIIPRKTGNDQWRLPIIGQIWAAMVIGTVPLFLISAVKLSFSFRKIQANHEVNNWILKQVSARLLQCAVGMALDLLVIVAIAIWTYHSSPRLLLMSISAAGWTQNLTSVLKMRSILVPTLPKERRRSKVRIDVDEVSNSSKYLPVAEGT